MPCITALNSAVRNMVLYCSIDSNGKAVHLLKNSSKNKRKREEIEEVKDEESKLKEDKQSYLR